MKLRVIRVTLRAIFLSTCIIMLIIMILSLIISRNIFSIDLNIPFFGSVNHVFDLGFLSKIFDIFSPILIILIGYLFIDVYLDLYHEFKAINKTLEGIEKICEK